MKMLHHLFVLAIVAFVVILSANEAFAQGGPANVKFSRGPGSYLSLLKIGGFWAVFLLWVRSADWANRDAQALKVNYVRWNPIILGTFFGAFVLTWLIPIFWVSFPLLVIAYLAPFITYVVIRNAKVPNNKRVFTPSHIRYCLVVALSKVGVEMEVEAADPHTKGSPVFLSAQGAVDERTDQVNLLHARQSPGMLTARQLIAGGMEFSASSIMLDFTQDSVGIRYLIDGVWLNQEPLDREMGDQALEALKLLCGLDPKERKQRLAGTFLVEYHSRKYPGTLISQGTKTGERVALRFIDEKIRFESLDELGMRDKMQERLRALVAIKKGFLLFAGAPTSGLRSTTNVALRVCDRFTREFMAIEDKRNRYEATENIPVTTYDSKKKETPLTMLPKVIRQMPDVIVIRDLVNGDTVGALCEEVEDNRLIIGTVRAKDSVDALLRVLALKVPPKTFAAGISAVFAQRLVRRLCEECKEAYTPTPQVLKQLGIPQGRVKAFYRPPEEPEEVCPECNGIGYKGQVAIFELLTVGDTVRKVLSTSPKPDLIRQAARKDGMRSLQEEGILLVAKGTTSLPELMRVLKQ